MLFHIPPALPAELLQVLASMGHGDELVIVDANYPAFADASHTLHGRPIDMPGRTLPQILEDIVTLLPLDTFDDTPVSIMASPGGTPAVHREAGEVLSTAPGGPWDLHPVERFAFYERARSCFALVRSLERRPYGNIILKAGVIAPDGTLMTPAVAAAAD